MSRMTGRPWFGAAGMAGLLLVGLAIGYFPGPAGAEASPGASGADQKAMDLLDKGEFAAAAGRFGQAQTLWNQALELRPGWSTAQRRLSELPQRRQRFPLEEAQRERRSAARLECVEAIEAFNHGDYGRAVTLWQGAAAALPEDEDVRRELDRARAMDQATRQGSLRVDCAQKAVVKLDGRVVGETPLELTGVAVGRRRVVVEAFGGQEIKELEIKPRTTSTLYLTVQGGGMVVRCSPAAEVFLDGRPMGQGPLELLNLALGPHKVEARAPGHRTQAVEVVLMAGEKPEVEFSLERQ